MLPARPLFNLIHSPSAWNLAGHELLFFIDSNKLIVFPPLQVYFPDIERCEWLNRVLKQVWPNANHYAKTLIKDTIEPNVQKALAGYKLNNFKFDRVILGTIVREDVTFFCFSEFSYISSI